MRGAVVNIASQVEESASAIEFLEEAGVDLGDINLCGGHSVPRTHW